MDPRTRRPESPPETTISLDPDERLNEVARVLALGIFRLRARKAPKTHKFKGLRENSLDSSAGQSVSGIKPGSTGEAP